MKKQMISMMLSGAILFSACEGALYTNYNSGITALAYSDDEVTEDKIEALDLDECGAACMFISEDSFRRENYSITVRFAAKEEGYWKFSSSDPSVATVKSEKYWHSGNEKNVTCFLLDIKKPGKTVITIKTENASCEVPVIVNNKRIDITSSSSSAAGNITIFWKPVTGVSGYAVYKGKVVSDEEGGEESAKNWKLIKTVSGANTSSATLSSYWGEKAAYRVATYVEHNGKKIFSAAEDLSDFGEVYAASKRGAQITSVAKSGSSSLKVT
ncbi:hypothetical protein [Ruminococcus sp. NK3A76]|uniref:hypothetical protein n=1 Tax=Ruminococcus sp. NK3A76 TaxID=877411 RepID=UPI00048B2EB5|nr:hypothetical protein [Ruminococcus sp. NK3A76]